MILIGQYDSPFVRRVAIALHIYRVDYEHRPWSVWGDAEALAQYNPLRRVPTLIVDDDTVLLDSFAILDWLDECAGSSALIPRSGVARREALRVTSLAAGLAEKAVSLLYEHVLREPDHRNRTWVERCTAQIVETLDRLEVERSRHATEYWFSDAIGHADIAVACALRFLHEAHPGLAAAGPALEAHAQRCEARPEFRAVAQPLTVTMKG